MYIEQQLSNTTKFIHNSTITGFTTFILCNKKPLLLQAMLMKLTQHHSQQFKNEQNINIQTRKTQLIFFIPKSFLDIPLLFSISNKYLVFVQVLLR